MTDAAPAPAAELSDEQILARFQSSTRHSPGTRLLGFRMLAVRQAEMTVEVAFDGAADRFANPMGQIQGGFVCAMLDEAMSVSVLVASKMTCAAPTLEMKTSFLRPAMPGVLRGVGRVVKWGRTIAFTEGELYDEAGRLLAKATGTAMPTPFSNFKKT
ncbi:MAG: PaaI family thioesterase [Alphaproteobacteria bacterium]